jgi:hypothetical protein
MRKFTIFTVAASAIVGIAASSQVASAATAAYWRHEEGPAGSLVPDGPETVLDASGNGNHMQTFSSAVAPYTSPTYTSSVSPLPLRSGLPNTLALDFGAGSDGVTPEGGEPNDDNYTTGEKPVNAQLMTAMTVELAFSMKSVGPNQWQALFGKDGKPLGNEEGEPDSPVPPFKMIVRGDSFPGDIPQQLVVEWIDGDGDIHLVSSGETIAVDSWYHVAFTLTNSDAQLWIAGETGPYVMADSIAGEDFANDQGRVLIEEPLGYTIGRGMFNNGVTDWSNALIDEVRLSDAALTADQFLFMASAPASDADFDNDNDVDGQDFLIWQRGNGAAGANGAGDANGDGQVNGADLTVWKEKFGGPPIAAVPEPATAALLAIACLILRKRR